MPENLTRREFIGELGKLGAAAAVVPMVAGGETMDTKPFDLGRPNWIKELDEPLTEVDWQQVARYNERHTTRRGFNLYVEQERIDQLGELSSELLSDSNCSSNNEGKITAAAPASSIIQILSISSAKGDAAGIIGERSFMPKYVVLKSIDSR